MASHCARAAAAACGRRGRVCVCVCVLRPRASRQFHGERWCTHCAHTTVRGASRSCTRARAVGPPFLTHARHGATRRAPHVRMRRAAQHAASRCAAHAACACTCAAFACACAATVQVAIKRISRVFQDLIDAKRIMRELKMLRHFGQHENIIEIYDIMTTPPHTEDFHTLYIVTQLYECDLERIITSSQSLTDQHLVDEVLHVLVRQRL
ncbi:hypothetical protein EON67_06200 [archaeon]|nr:MAG: hypothetical protein EON67_06200 [archaeon]